MPDHRFALSAEVHEPKHITSATTADAGKVITPSATTSGESELRNLTEADIGLNYAFGEVEVNNNTSSFSVTAASETTLHDPADFVLLNSVRIATTSGELLNMTRNTTDNSLVVDLSGIYRVGGWANVKSDTTSSKIGLRFAVNGTVNGGVLITDIKDIGRTENLSGFGLIALTAGDAVSAAMACDKTANITVEDMRLNLSLVMEN